MVKIIEVKKEHMNALFKYLAVHISENGNQENILFQPLTKEQSKLNSEWKEKFESGLSKSFDEYGWRKLWIAMNEENQIIGHVDIRPYNEFNTKHRVQLGMGVDSNFRNLRIGQELIEFVIDYCKKQPAFSWLDLQVMTNNVPAIKLYEKMNFKEISTAIDMFRIDAISYDYTSMTLQVD